MSWTLIEHQTLTSSVASVTLGSGGTIPQTYKTLKLVVSARGSTGSFPNPYVQVNSISSGYSWRGLYGDGLQVGSNNSGSATAYLAGAISSASETTNTFGSVTVEIPNYSGSTNKPVSVDAVGENNGTTSYLYFVASLLSNSAAITSLTMTLSSGNFVSGSTFTLYGLA